MAIKFKNDNEVSENEENLGVTVNGEPINNKEKKKKFSFEKLFFVLAVIVTTIMALYALAPFATALLFVTIGVIWVIAVIGATLFTLGLVWMSDGYREFVSNLSKVSGDLTNGEMLDKIFNFLAVSYWYVLFIGIGCIAMEIILHHLNKQKNLDNKDPDAKERKAGMIVQIVIFVIAGVFAFISLISSK